MSRDLHLARHKRLHELAAELVADFLSHQRGTLQTATVYDLMRWSDKQTRWPDELGRVGRRDADAELHGVVAA